LRCRLRDEDLRQVTRKGAIVITCHYPPKRFSGNLANCRF
jgi:hypothetical protein